MDKRLRKAIRFLLPLTVCLLLFSLSAAASSKTVKMVKKETRYTYSYAKPKYDTVYVKFKVSYPCTFLVTGLKKVGDSTYGMTLELCGKKKKVLESAFVNAKQKGSYATWALNKGTYYLKADGLAAFALAGQVYKIPDRNGISQNSAAAVNKNVEVTGILASGENTGKADWYKFYLPEQVLHLQLKAKGTGSAMFYLYGPSYAYYPNGYFLGSLRTGKASFRSANSLKEPVAIAPGWYYLKVCRTSSVFNSSSTYSLRWW